MNNGSIIRRSPITGRGLAIALASVLAFIGTNAWAKSAASGTTEVRRYIVELQDPPLAAYDGGDLSVDGPSGPLRMAATAPESTGEKRLNARSPASRAYLAYLAERQAEAVREIESVLGRKLVVPNRYGHVNNGFSVDLRFDEVEDVRRLPQVRSIEADRLYRVQTYAGPQWIGAASVWNGEAGYPEARGEGVIVGVVDTGINWDHPSFDDSPSDGYVFSNPFGEGLGLCDDPEVLCNEKVIGVYDFVEDRTETPDFEEEYTKGKDNDGHGSHTASIAAGRAISATFDGATRTMSGVAPLAHLISYRACYVGISDPPSDENSGCWGEFLIAAINQAAADGVDVINYSIGGDVNDPWWQNTVERAFLNARGAGIFIATSAGNDGPEPGTITSPALAPWLVAVGNATRDRITGTTLESFSGGGLPAPESMTGASLVGGTNKLPVVHARDYGFPLCGTGPAELGATCTENTGSSNPWVDERPFEGLIVVCDRGTYGRIEKGKNVRLAGAAGYILANTEATTQDIVADQHCLPAAHVSREDGDILREWLASGTGHGVQISSVSNVANDAAADILSFRSSRGPAGEALPKLANLLKPNLIAPGTEILAAWSDLSARAVSGTSMASPHVAGAAALIKSVHPDWSANELVSALETTATPALAMDWNGFPATTEQVGAGRPRIDEAVNIGLYLEVSRVDFLASNPDPQVGGDLRRLNLPSLVDAECKSSCTFQRTVTDLMGGGEWTATAEGFPAGALVTITPDQFDLPSGASRDIEVQIDISNTGVIGDWVSGKIRLSTTGAADQYLTVSVQPSDAFEIVDDSNSGWKEYLLRFPDALPDATFSAGGLTPRDSRTELLVEDPTRDDPYDGGEGVFTAWYELPDGALWFFAETPASTAEDVDLFVGRDINGNRVPEASEELCSSTTPEDLERCEFSDLPAGDYWIIVQNWEGNLVGGDDVTLLSAAITANDGPGLAASGPGIVGANEPFSLRLSWEDVTALPGETWFGAVGIGSSRETPNDLGIIPVRFTRDGIAPASTLPLMAGRDHGLALAGGDKHDLVFIDIPPGIESLTVQAAGADATQSDNLRIDLVRFDFADAFSEPPFAKPADGQPVVVSASGTAGAGPVVTVEGGVEPGRWYPIVRNDGAEAAAVSIRAEVQQDGVAVEPMPGLWSPRSRPNEINQGFEFNWADDTSLPHFLVWYTYDESGRPEWFFASAERNGQNIWTADLLRITNDGAAQQLQPVGSVSLSLLAGDDAMFSYTLYGASGSERMAKLGALTCPEVSGVPTSYTGHWYRGTPGLGGATVLMIEQVQYQAHYLFDAFGEPRWLIAQDPAVNDPLAPTIPLLQFSGFCAVCDYVQPGYNIVGTLDRSFDSESTGSWTLDFVFDPPLTGAVQRTDAIQKLSHRIDCE